MSKASTVVAFIFGAAAGTAATWYFTKKKYEQIIEAKVQEQVDSIKESFANRYSEQPKTDSEEESETEAVISLVEAAKDKPSIMEYAARLQKEGYTNYSGQQTEEKEMTIEERAQMKPKIISPDEFGDNDDYDQISLTYFEDEVLVDDNFDVIHNVEEIVGYDSLDHFGEYEDDSVHVRNDRLKVDYEILRDERTYAQFIEQNPYKAEV